MGARQSHLPADLVKWLRAINEVRQLELTRRGFLEEADWEKFFCDRVGFALKKKQSSIPQSGDGVFLARGRASAHKLLTLYPGTFYDVSDFDWKDTPAEDFESAGVRLHDRPIKAQDLLRGNVYAISHPLGFTLDGRPNGISRGRFLGALVRSSFAGIDADTSWLKPQPAGLEMMPSPLAFGHMFNHSAKPGANARFQLFSASLLAEDAELQQHIPSLDFSADARKSGSLWNSLCGLSRLFGSESPQLAHFRVMGVVATRDIEAEEEVFLDYEIEPSALGRVGDRDAKDAKHVS